MRIYTLAQVVAHARAYSPFYRELYAELPAGELALESLPVVDQARFWQANAMGGANRVLTGLIQDGIVYRSGGTTGNPKFSVYTREEWATFCELFGTGMSRGAIEAGDRIANLFYAGDLYASFLFIHGALERAPVGSVIFPLNGALAPAAVAGAVTDFAINVLAGVPTTLLALADAYLRSGQRLPSVQKILFGGESMYGDQRAVLERAFPGVRVLTIGYASVDGGLLGFGDAECAPDEHRVFDEGTRIEILCEETGAPITEAGRTGRLVATNLTRLLMPIIRYPAGDRAQWVEPLGTPQRKFTLRGRSGEAARIGVVSLYYEDVRQILEPLRARTDHRAFQLLIAREAGLDTLTIRISRPDASRTDPALSAEILGRLLDSRPTLGQMATQGKIGHSRIEWVEPPGIQVNPRTGKLRSVIDLRR